MRDVDLPDPTEGLRAEPDDSSLHIVEEPTGQPREREARVVSQDEIDEADGTGAYAPQGSTTDEPDQRDAEPGSPARI